MTNEERLQQVQAYEYKQRNLLIAAASLVAVVLLFAIGTYGGRFIQHRRQLAAERAAERALQAELALAESGETPVLEALLPQAETRSSLIGGASSASASILQQRQQALEEARLLEEQEAAAALAAMLPEGYVWKTVTEDDIHKGELQLINKDHAYHFLEEDQLSLIYDQDGGNYYLASFQIRMTQNTADHLHQLLGAFYEETGYQWIMVLNGFRSAEESQEIYDREVETQGKDYADAYTMQAGFSEHHSGLATDIVYYPSGNYFDQSDEELSWFYEHMADYGFIVRYPEDKVAITQIAHESWHLRYVGYAAAQDIYRKGLCLEEWIDLIHESSATDPYEIDTDQGTYTVYYVPATANPESGRIEIPVPGTGSYTVSGDNIEGYIVTVSP